MCEKTEADMSENKLKMPISLQPPPAHALTAQPRPLIPCVNEWCPQNNTQSPLSIHLALAISLSPFLLHYLLYTPSPYPLCHPSFSPSFCCFHSTSELLITNSKYFHDFYHLAVFSFLFAHPLCFSHPTLSFCTVPRLMFCLNNLVVMQQHLNSELTISTVRL